MMSSMNDCHAKCAQQSVHLTLGILRHASRQAASYALSFFWLDGFAVPALAQVTHTVSPQGNVQQTHKLLVFLEFTEG